MTYLIQLMAAFAVATASDSHAHTAIPSISPSGPYSVGRRAVIWTDSSRRDPTDTTRFRDVSAWIWYPAKRSSEDALESPLPKEWQTQRLEALKTKLGPDVAQAMQSFAVHARTDAPVVGGSDRLPVLLFVPGLSWLASDYSILVEDLASHGYVVVGISPSGFSDPVVFPDSRIVHRTLGMGEKIGTEQSYVHDDALFALERIQSLNQFFHNRLDLQHIGAFGHSLGGTSALVLADRDSTVRAAINIDGDAMGDVREARPHQPILLISSDEPTIDEAPQNPSMQHMQLVREGLERSAKRRTDEWSAISSQSVSAHRVRIPGTHHLNFEDAALASGLITAREARWMKFGNMEPAQALTTLATIVRSFFDESFGRSRANDVCAGIPECLRL